MPGNKEHQEICVVGRLFSLEALVVIMGVVSLVYGVVTAQAVSIIIGVAVLGAILVLTRWCRRNQAK
ncbi:hypothetical protein GMLC_05930 [Geomonas limicola]|uniref:Uncharacterized protein n=1 Tax=Geomonas limicola TaxID=2740186 RepID=A0A6V8N4Y4_9BACT|nr:hypothetical protein [Geomonas limicola]GFO67014.1 hypothetical protein GMLC_05930 [Geomonas limicola]